MWVTPLKVISPNGILLPSFTVSWWWGAVMLQFALQPPRPRPCHNGDKSHFLPKADGDVGSSEAGVQRSPIGIETPMQKYFI